MLIQSTGNMAQVQHPASFASDGAAPMPANVSAQPSAKLELPQAAVKPAAEQKVTNEQVKNAVENINKVLKQSDKSLEFSVDESTKKQMFKLTDMSTGDVIRQYPTEEMLSISRAIDQVQQGLLLRQEA
ncbi:MAG: flagellar protein FlaG [Sulfuricellaceae bacterium]